MAVADVAPRPQDRSNKRRPFTSWVKRLANRKSSEQNGSNGKKGSNLLMLSSRQQKKSNGTIKNNPYPASGYVHRSSPRSSTDGQLSVATSNQHTNADNGSVNSDAVHDRDGPAQSNRSAAPTVMTNAETLHSDAGHSKAATTTTGGGAVSIVDGAGGGSTFSSPNQSERSLTTTLTTIQSTSAGNVLQQPGHSGAQQANQQQSTQQPVMFSHQYPVSPTPSNFTASAIPRHVSEAHGNPGSSVLTDNASILTLASSSKHRRRSMDTDASVRALAPSSVWGGSRESLPLSVLSSNVDPIGGFHSNPRPSIGGLASAERASVYSQQGITAPALHSDRNSYYAGAQKKELPADAKSLRSLNNLDTRSQYDAKSINDAKSMDVASMRGREGSVRHGRQDSIPGSIGSPLSPRNPASAGVSRRSSDWAERTDRDGERPDEEDERAGDDDQGKPEHARPVSTGT